jgi:hypothetical protein
MPRRRFASLLALGLALISACSAAPPASTTAASASAHATPRVSEPVRSAGPSAPSESELPGSDVGRILADLEALQAIADQHGGIRAAGTPGYDASVEHVAGLLRDIGFEVEEPEVAYTSFRELPGARLEVGDRVIEGSDELRALLYSASGDVTGTVVELARSGCDASDFAGVLDGAIVLTTQGGCFRRDQALNAMAAGAVALVVGYPDRGPGEIYRPTLIDPAAIDIPVVSVTGATVDLLRQERAARLVVETERAPSTTRNVIAELGSGPSVLMLGAHLDSVLDGPGINDNGSGVVALLEVARAMAAAGVPEGWTVRIGLWAAEELGSIGSRAYASGIGDEVRAYLNLDMTGSVNGANLVYAETGAVPGSEAITIAYEAWFAARGLDSHRADLGGASDHFGFIEAGIPTGGLFSGATETGGAANPSSGGGAAMDPCYHLACDTVDNVDLERVARFADATSAVVLELIRGGLQRP